MKYVLNDLLSGWFALCGLFSLLYLLSIPLTFVVSLIKRILGYDSKPFEKTMAQIKMPFTIEERGNIIPLLCVYTGLLVLLKWLGFFDNVFDMPF